MNHKKEILAKKLKTFLSENKTVGDLYIYYGPPAQDHIDKIRKSTPHENCLVYVLSEGSSETLKIQEDNSLLVSDCESFEEDIWLVVSVLKCRNLIFSAITPKDKPELLKISEIRKTAENALLNWSHFSSSIMIKLRCSLLNLPLIINGLSLNAADASDIPVIICGAGPSLNQQIDLLKKFRTKIFIVSAGRVGSLLMKHGITPDVMVQVDPETDYDSYNGKISESILAAITNVSHKSALSFPQIIWGNGDSSYFNKLLKDAGIVLNDFTVSKTSTVTAIDFAVKSGFRRITLIGNDLCLSESKALHAEGYIDDGIYGVYELSVKGNEQPEVPSTPELTLLRLGIEQYLEKLYNEKVIRIFNSTIGGARISHSEKLSLESFIEAANTFSKTNIVFDSLKQPVGIMDRLRQCAHDFERFINLAKENLTCTDAIIKECGKTSPDSWELQTLDQMDLMLTNREKFLAEKPITGNLIAAVNDQCSLVIPEPLDTTDPHNLKFLNYKKNKYQFILDLSMDIKRDLDYSLSENTIAKIMNHETVPLKGTRNHLSFISFRNSAIRFVKKSNPEYAEMLSGDYFDKYKAAFEFTNNWQNIPYVRKFISEKFAVPVSADYLHMDKIAEKEVADFLKSTNFNISKNAVVFVAPGNWLHPLMFSLLCKNANIAVIDPWPVVFSEMINCSLFTDSLSEKTVIIALDETLKDAENIYNSFREKMNSEGKKILFFEHPQTWNLPEIKKLLQFFA